jgi:MFS family permease
VSNADFPQSTTPGASSTDRRLFVVLVASVLAGMALRVFGVASWDLVDDEFYTFRDSLENPSRRGLFSLYYHVTHVSLRIFGATIFGVRLPALLLGLGALLVLYGQLRDTFGRRTAVFAVVLLSFSHWHVEASQFARYYAAVFLLGALHFTLFLRFLRTGSVRFLLLSWLAGGLAVGCHFMSCLLFAVTGLYSLLALRWGTLLPHPAARKPLLYSLGVLIVVGIFLLPTAVRMLVMVAGKKSWGIQGWAQIPLLAFNGLSVPVFVAVFLGLWCLRRKDTHPEFTLATIGVATALVALGVLGSFLNVTPKYVFSLAPLFFVSVGALCRSVYDRFESTNVLVALSPCIVLVSAVLPPLASYYLERHNISQRAAVQYVVDHAEPGQVLLGNVASPFVELGTLRREKYPAAPDDASFDWSGYLKRYTHGREGVWFVWDVPRSGLAPDLEQWLHRNAELRHQQRARCIEPRARTITVWWKGPGGP